VVDAPCGGRGLKLAHDLGIIEKRVQQRLQVGILHTLGVRAQFRGEPRPGPALIAAKIPSGLSRMARSDATGECSFGVRCCTHLCCHPPDDIVRLELVVYLERIVPEFSRHAAGLVLNDKAQIALPDFVVRSCFD